MNLISKEEIDGTKVFYYDGIDIDYVKNHPNDGSSGYLFCFVDSWIGEIKNYNRCTKIDNIIDNKKIENFDISDINNNYVCIYQTNGLKKDVYETIRKNIQTRIGKPWLVLPGIR